jgi:hypothetical protein
MPESCLKKEVMLKKNYLANFRPLVPAAVKFPLSDPVDFIFRIELKNNYQYPLESLTHLFWLYLTPLKPFF